MKLFIVSVLVVFSAPVFAGILCKSEVQGIEELYVGYSSTKGCFISLKKTDDTDFFTKILNPGTTDEKYDCAETSSASGVKTVATLNIDPLLLEPGEQNYDFKIETRGGVRNFEFTFTMNPEYVWIIKDLDCVQTSDLE